ncbi:MAG: 50S ribosomal protein L24 [Spirochaetia bacterium]|nr:50S ribosomal protein L24 [Spirochaetia bacterium]MBR4436147.1 50S ribosomal protein L24 [Spirochaetales bacterium]MBR4796988.1 50S ribosomal protein L24 [Spirochaetia bacterium]MBR5016503.1 50S ribosomal protein L24 [Spirochaetia bacterium]MBR5927383.1 50S ribosomal protein L24 [Spirochaetia bacterium]
MEVVKYKLKKDDLVQVITGKEKGKSGKILKIDREKGKVLVAGLNMVKKARKPRRQGEKGGIVDIEAPIDISNVMIVCKKCGPTRIGIEGTGDKKVRKCKKCGEVL